MKRMFAGILGALLVAGLVGTSSSEASAGGRGHHRYSRGCNCDGPVVRVVPAGTEYVITRQVINTHRVVPRVRVIDHNRVIVHRRTVVHRHIVLHRNHTHYKNITVNRINTAHRFQTVHKRQVVHRTVNTKSSSYRTRTVRRDCNCGPGQKGYRGMKYYRKHAVRSRY
jgi:hypothetical protein